MREKVYKFIAIALLTLLIWAWAFLSLEEDETYRGSLEISPSTSPELLATFQEGQQRISLEIQLRGAPDKVAELSKRNQSLGPEQERLDYYYNPEQHDDHVLDILDLIKEDPKTKQLALTLISCKPDKVKVNIEKLVSQELSVQVLDENGAVVKHEEIKPARVKVYTRNGYNGPAKVILTARQIEAARKAYIQEIPFVLLGTGDQKRDADQSVAIRLPLKEPLKDQQPMQRPRIGYIWPAEMQGKYRAELLNESDFRTVKIKATDEAMRLYEQQQHHILIQVNIGDEGLDQVPQRPVIYNFPHEIIKRELIQPPDPPAKARVKLIPTVPVNGS